MGKLQKDDLSKLGHKINQLKKRISRTEVSGNTEKIEFRKMRIGKIKKHIKEIISKKKKNEETIFSIMCIRNYTSILSLSKFFTKQSMVNGWVLERYFFWITFSFNDSNGLNSCCVSFFNLFTISI